MPPGFPHTSSEAFIKSSSSPRLFLFLQFVRTLLAEFPLILLRAVFVYLFSATFSPVDIDLPSPPCWFIRFSSSPAVSHFNPPPFPFLFKPEIFGFWFSESLRFFSFRRRFPRFPASLWTLVTRFLVSVLDLSAQLCLGVPLFGTFGTFFFNLLLVPRFEFC